MLLTNEEADRIVTKHEFIRLVSIIKEHEFAIRCNKGNDYKEGDGFNIWPTPHDDSRKYATHLYASIGFAKKTILGPKNEYCLLLLDKCALSRGDEYRFVKDDKVYMTFPKCHGLGPAAEVVAEWSMHHGLFDLARKVIEHILSMELSRC